MRLISLMILVACLNYSEVFAAGPKGGGGPKRNDKDIATISEAGAGFDNSTGGGPKVR